MAKFQLQPIVGTEAFTYRAGTIADPLVQNDRGKAVTLTDDNQVGLAAAGDEILGFLSSIEIGTHDGFVLCGVQEQDFQKVDTGAAVAGDIVKVTSNPVSGVEGLTVVETVDPTDHGTVLIKWMVVRPGLVKRI